MRAVLLVGLGMVTGVLVGLYILAPETMLGSPSMPQTSIAVHGSGNMGDGGSADATLHIARLEAEASKLKKQLANRYKSEIDSSILEENNTVTIPLMKFLGLSSFYAGVTWDPLICVPPTNIAFPKVTDDQLKQLTARLTDDLVKEQARIRGVSPSDILVGSPWFSAVRGAAEESEDALPSDKHFDEWRSRLLPIMFRYMSAVASGGDHAVPMFWHLGFTCRRLVGKISVGEFQVENLGDKNSEECIKEIGAADLQRTLGVHPRPYQSIESMAHDLIHTGLCTVRDLGTSYAKWLKKERMYNESWKTFNVDSLERDAVIMLFDVLYEKLKVFTRQYWLGVITMQNPFDMYSIQDIIHTIEPDFIIETGTANGGSALLWSSIMHLSDLENSRVITIDQNEPSWEKGMNWGGEARQDPTKHELWKKHVHFLKGSSVDRDMVEKVKGMVKGKKVMVLLDAHHATNHVLQEMEAYCPLVAVGSYCIIEDTKLSRWSNNGPKEAVDEFMSKYRSKWEQDRSRELLYSQHTMGYLRRIEE